MPKALLLSLALVVLATRAFCMKGMEFDCAELGPGASQSYEQTFQVRNKFVSTLVVGVEASNPGTSKAPKCHVKWTVTAKLLGRSRVLFQHENDPEYPTNGVAFDGTSPDGTKLLLDFFTAGGDYTGHRPAVYDLTTNTWQIRDVGIRVTEKLPRCDYFTMIQGVTDAGDVVLYVPKSIYVDKGCPDQGEWVLNMKTDAITRVDKADAPPQTQPSR
ncbi:MAG TPA: hypothetical protein VKE93_10235 [Candidatus Angelobacter sp.]|nr:hypothetical protein [Candidatus Angelobacter sp.]